MSRLEDNLNDSCGTTTSAADGNYANKNQEEALCTQFAAMHSPSRPSQQKNTSGEDLKSLGKCSDDSTTALHDMVESALIGLQKDWKGRLVLKCLPMTLQDVENPEVSGEPYDDINICDYLGGQKEKCIRLNFSPSKFPPSSDSPFAKGNDVWMALKRYIEHSSYTSEQSDSPVVCTAGASSGMGKKFACRIMNDSNKKKRKEKRTDVDFRQTFLLNDGERGERPNGRALPRKTSCQDASRGSCGFSFTVKCDSKGYHITLKRSGGNCVHSHHANFNSTDASSIPTPLRLLSDNDKKELRNVHKTEAGEAMCSAYLYQKLGEYYDRGKIAYLFDSEKSSAKEKEEKEFHSDVDSMLKELTEDENTACAVFWDVAADGNNGCRLVSESKDFDQRVTVADLSSEPNMEKVQQFVQGDRNARNIRSDQNLFLSVMWIDKGEIAHLSFVLYVAFGYSFLTPILLLFSTTCQLLQKP